MSSSHPSNSMNCDGLEPTQQYEGPAQDSAATRPSASSELLTSAMPNAEMPRPPIMTGSAAADIAPNPPDSPAITGVENHPSSSSDAPMPMAQIMSDSEKGDDGNDEEAPSGSRTRLPEIIEDEGAPSPPHQHQDAAMAMEYHEKMLGSKVETIDDGDEDGPPVHPGAYETAEDNFDLEKGTNNEPVRPLPTTMAPPKPPVHPGAYKTAEDDFELEKVSDSEPPLPLPSASTAASSLTSMPSVGPSIPHQDREPRIAPDEDEENSKRDSPIQPVQASVMPSIRPPPPSMLRRQSSVSNEPDAMIPILEAHAVEEEPPQPVYHGTPVEEEHWIKRHLKRIFAVIGFIVVGMAIALGVAFGSRDDAPLRMTVTSSPTVSASPSLDRSTMPSALPTSSVIPSTSISPSTTMPPSVQPTEPPSFSPRRCFIDRNELKAAVDEYVAGGIRCSQENSCRVTQEYGWPIGTWCVKNVTDMSYLFLDKGTFNDDLSFWEVSLVRNMAHMFHGATSFNGDVSNWDTSSVQDMEWMFARSSFNGDVSSWNTSRATTMQSMFSENSAFNGDISKWDTSSVEDMSFMFWNAALFNQSLCEWGVNFPYEQSVDIFSGSGCQFQGNPQETQNGPFCASLCYVPPE
mmetsp:Transcript_3005/g.5658  ORF Transcript_3005/g.5658 Transcript_3005/m.5658 type:complete len:631 (+) Transcript_3005:298-2190(+)